MASFIWGLDLGIKKELRVMDPKNLEEAMEIAGRIEVRLGKQAQMSHKPNPIKLYPCETSKTNQ